jgi:hypothetical protein
MVLQRLRLTKVSARAGLSLFGPYLQPIGCRRTDGEWPMAVVLPAEDGRRRRPPAGPALNP